MKILLDTNFIITCVKQKINIADAIENATSEQVEFLVPQDVLNELGIIKDAHPNSKDATSANLAFQLLQELNPTIVNLPGKNPNVDIKIVNYILGKKIILATLDKGLKQRVKNKILTIRGKKKLEII